LKKGAVKDFEARFKRKDGSVFWLSLNSATFVTNTGPQIVTIFQDITERKLMEKQIQELSGSIAQRLIQKIAQMDNVSQVKDKLRASPDVSTGLDLLLNTVLNDLGMDIGAVMLVSSEENAVKIRGFKTRVEGVKLPESYPLYAEFAELEVVKGGRSVSKILGQGELAILKTRSVHCVPILLGGEARGILALGSQKDLVLDSSDLALLNLYSELVSTLFETERLTVSPVKESKKGAKRQFELEFGCSYLVKNSVEKAFDVFVDNVLSGVEGLCITREFPPKVRRKYGLTRTPVVWLTEEKAKDQVTVNSLQDLSILIAGFLQRSRRGIVLLDGFEYLITNNGFESFFHFLQLNRSRFEQDESILVAPVSEEALDVKQVRLVEREMKPLKV